MASSSIYSIIYTFIYLILLTSLVKGVLSIKSGNWTYVGRFRVQNILLADVRCVCFGLEITVSVSVVSQYLITRCLSSMTMTSNSRLVKIVIYIFGCICRTFVFMLKMMSWPKCGIRSYTFIWNKTVTCCMSIWLINIIGQNLCRVVLYRNTYRELVQGKSECVYRLYVTPKYFSIDN